MGAYTAGGTIQHETTDGSNLIVERKFFIRPGNDGKAINLRADDDILIRDCFSIDCKNAFIRARNCNRIHMEDLDLDGRNNSEKNFMMILQFGDGGGKQIGNEVDDLRVKHTEMRNIRYGGTASFFNGDGAAVEPLCTNILFHQVMSGNAPDTAFDFKAGVTLVFCIGHNCQTGFKLWGNQPAHVTFNLIGCISRNTDRGIEVLNTNCTVNLYGHTYEDYNRTNIQFSDGATAAQVNTFDLADAPLALLIPPYPTGYTESQKNSYDLKSRGWRAALDARPRQTLSRKTQNNPKIDGGWMGSIIEVANGISSGVTGYYVESATRKTAAMHVSYAAAVAWVQASPWKDSVTARASVEGRLAGETDGCCIRLGDNEHVVKESNVVTSYGRPMRSKRTDLELGWTMKTIWDSGQAKSDSIVTGQFFQVGGNGWTIPVSSIGTAWDEANFTVLVAYDHVARTATERILMHLLKDTTHYHKIYGDHASDTRFTTSDAGGSTDTGGTAFVEVDISRICYTYDRATNTAKLYEAGVKIEEDVAAEDPTGILNLHFGSLYPGLSLGHGERISEILILPRVLTEADAIYETTLANGTFSQFGIGDV